MGERRGTSVVSQKTLGEAPEVGAPEPRPAVLAVQPPPDPTPKPADHGPVAPSSASLQERQLRWFRERDRRAAATKDPPGPADPS